MKKTISMLALLMLFIFIFSSCAGERPVESGPSTTEALPEATADGTDQTEQPAETVPTLEIKNFAGDTIRIIWPEPHGDGHYMHDEINVAADNGDIIDSAVFKRNRKVEDDYKVKIESVLVWCSKIADTVTKTIATGSGDDYYDAFCASVKMLTSPALEGKWTNFLTMPGFSSDMPWWDARIMKEFSLGGRQFFASGDIIYSDNFYPYSVFANLDMYNDYWRTGESLFSLVKNRQWTLDKMMEICATAPVSTDDVWNYEDQYGVLVNTNLARAMLFSTGQRFVESNDVGEVSVVLKLEGVQTVLEKMVKLFHDGHLAYDTDDDIGHNIPGMTHAQTAIKMYTSGQSIFYTEELIIAERLVNADSTINTGILPLPLFTAEQEKYVCPMNDAVVIGVPVNADPEKSSFILSAMSRESMTTLTPAFYDVVLTFRYADNPESVEMLDIILAGAQPQDIGTILDWGGVISAFKNNVSVGSVDFSGKFSQTMRQASMSATRFNNDLAKLDG